MARKKRKPIDPAPTDPVALEFGDAYAEWLAEQVPDLDLAANWEAAQKIVDERQKHFQTQLELLKAKRDLARPMLRKNADKLHKYDRLRASGIKQSAACRRAGFPSLAALKAALRRRGQSR